MSKFSKGDKIKATESHLGAITKGKVYTVIESDGDGVEFIGDSGSRRYRLNHRFEKVAAHDFKVGDKVKVIRRGFNNTTHRFIGDDTGKTVTVIKPRAGYATGNEVAVEYGHGGWDIYDASCLEAVKPPTTFAKGDRVEFKSVGGNRFLGTVIDPTEKVDPYDSKNKRRVTNVQLDGGQRSYRRDLTLDSLTKVEPEPKAQPKFKVGDRVTANNRSLRRKGQSGTIVKFTPSASITGNDYGAGWYVIDFDLAGRDTAGIWENFLDAEGFKPGDKVLTTSVAYHSHREGKPATIVRKSSGTRYAVKFADGAVLFADVTAYDESKVRFRDLDDAVKAAKIKANKIEKLQRLAKELGYDVYPVAS